MPDRATRSLLFLGVTAAALALLAPRDAQAQSADDLDRARARAVAGLSSLEAKAYATALSECEDALRVIDAPTILLCKARALVGLGRLDEARVAYRAVLNKPLPAGAPPAWVDARAAAETELKAATKALLERYERVFTAKLAAGEYATALEATERSLAVERTLSAALAQARALGGLERFREAFVAFDAVLKLLDSLGSADGVDRGAVQTEAEALRRKASDKVLTKGATRLDERDFEGALAACNAADALVPSGAAVLCVAAALDGLGQAEEALRRYERLFSDATRPLSEAQRTKATRELEALRKKLGPARLTLRAAGLPGLRVSVDGDVAQALTGERSLELPRGAHSVRAAAPGHVPLVEVVKLKGGAAVAFPIELRPLPPLRLAGWISLGVGVAGLGAGAVLASQAVATNDELTAVCTQSLKCGPSQASAIDSLSAMRIGTFVAGGLGAAALLASGGLHFFMPSDTMPEAPKVSFGPGGLTVTGAF